MRKAIVIMVLIALAVVTGVHMNELKVASDFEASTEEYRNSIERDAEGNIVIRLDPEPQIFEWDDYESPYNSDLDIITDGLNVSYKIIGAKHYRIDSFGLLEEKPTLYDAAVSIVKSDIVKIMGIFAIFYVAGVLLSVSIIVTANRMESIIESHR